MKLTGLILALIHLVFAMLVCFEILDVLGWAGVTMVTLDYPCALLLNAMTARHLSFDGDLYVAMIGLGTVWWYLIGACLEVMVQRLRLRLQTKPQA